MERGTRQLRGKVLPAAKNYVFSLGGAINLGFVALDTLSNMRERNMSFPGALGRAALTFAAVELIPGYIGASIIADLAKVAGQAAVHGYRNAPYTGLMRAGHFEATRVIDTANMATMRQRSLAALAQSRMNARSILGSEARMLHRNQVSY